MGPLFIVTPHWDPTLGRSIAKWVPFCSLLVIWELMRVTKITWNATQGGQAPELKLSWGRLGAHRQNRPSRRGFGSHTSSWVLSRNSAGGISQLCPDWRQLRNPSLAKVGRLIPHSAGWKRPPGGKALEADSSGGPRHHKGDVFSQLSTAGTSRAPRGCGCRSDFGARAHY